MKKEVTEFVENLYKGFHEVSLYDLRGHLEEVAKVGCSGRFIEELFAIKELNWDIGYVERAIENLGEEEDYG